MGIVVSTVDGKEETKEIITPSLDFSKQDMLFKIHDLKNKLNETDWVANKISEANLKYLINNDKSYLLNMYEKYKEEISNREAWREEINKLEEKLKEV